MMDDGRRLKKLEGEFRDHLAAINRSESTIKSYLSGLRAFTGFLKGRKTNWDEVTWADVMAYLAWMMTCGRYSTGSVQTRLTAVKAFYKFTTLHGYTKTNPAKMVEYPRIEKRLPRDVPTVTEMKKLLKAPPDTDVGLRDKCYLHLLYSGLRRTEACNLRLADIDTSGGLVTVRDGKGGADRTCPISRETCILIRSYVLTVRPKWVRRGRGAKDFLLLGVWGRPFSNQIAARMVKDYAKEAGIKKNITCHSLRHACASHLLQSQRVTAVDIRDLLGHRRLTTTQRYLHLFPESHKAVKHHPLELGRED